MVRLTGVMTIFKSFFKCQTSVSLPRMFGGVQEHIICRLCLGRHSSHLFLIDADISQKILDCCALQVFLDDGMPNRICEECLTTLDLVVSFRRRCAESDRLLKDGFFDVKVLKCELDILDDECQPERIYEKILPKKIIKPPSRLKKVNLDENRTQNDIESPNLKIVNDIVKTKVKKRRKFSIITPGLCPFCGKTFNKLNSLHSHLRLHTKTKTHSCVECSKSFRELRQLKEHERTHLNIKNIPCIECGRLFGTRSTANKHFEAVHRKSNTVSCKLCNKILSSNRCLKGHMKTHTGEREFICDICKRAFAFKSTLIIHIRSHTGEKPYKCKYCDSRFSAPKSYKDHERLHTGVKPYVCPVCSKAYSQKCNMKSHFKNNHKDVELIV